MAQVSINTHKKEPQQKPQNILDDVTIQPAFYQHWMDALGQFAVMIRLQKGMKHIVLIEKEECFINAQGELTLSTEVSEETLQMSFPKGTWNWKKQEEA